MAKTVTTSANQQLARVGQQASQIQQGSVRLKAVVVPKSGSGHFTVRVQAKSTKRAKG